MSLRRDLARAAGHLPEERLVGLTQHHYEKHSDFVCRHGSHYIEYQHQTRSGSHPKLDPKAEEEHRRGFLDQALLQSHHPVWSRPARDPLVGTAKA
jgi:hypothetical protein